MPWATRKMRRRGVAVGRQAGSFPGPLPTQTSLTHCPSFLPSDAVVSQVLDELGLSLTDELSSECSKPIFSPSLPSSATALNPRFSLQTSPPLVVHSVWLLGGRKQRPQPQPWLMLMQTWKRGSRTFAGTEQLSSKEWTLCLTLSPLNKEIQT